MNLVGSSFNFFAFSFELIYGRPERQNLSGNRGDFRPGEATAHALAQRNATVILVARDMGRAWATLGRIKSQTGNSSLESMIYDLSSQAEIRELAADFKSKYQRLDVLVNNAGAWFNKRQNRRTG